MRRGALLVLLALAACSEEDRRAWVSILPIDEDETRATAGGPFAVASDSTAALLGGDTLFTVARLPARAPDGSVLQPARIVRAELAPDTSSVAVVLRGATPAVVVWSRSRQSANVAGTFPDGEITVLAWSPDGRLLAFEGRDSDSVAYSRIFDVQTGLTGRHPVLQWFARQQRSVRFQSWADARNARFLVSPSASPEGGLAFLWDIRRGAFLLEAHAGALAANAPAGTGQPGSVFSVDLAGDPAPETVALYRAVNGAPGALVLADAGPGGVRSATTEPLVPIEVVGLEEWGDARMGAALYQIATVGGRTTLLLALPAESPIMTLGLFQVGSDGRLRALEVAAPGGDRPALFADGTIGQDTRQIGIVDLDGDGSAEIVASAGRADPAPPAIRWSAEVFLYRDGRLIPAPDLAPVAIERLERLVGGG